MEGTLALRCEDKIAGAIDGVLSAAYPDVRLGHRFGGQPEPLRGQLAEPGHVLRYRKDRSFVYALSSEADKDASPPIEAIAQEQAAVGTPSSVRFQLTPAPLFVETCFARLAARARVRSRPASINRVRAGSRRTTGCGAASHGALRDSAPVSAAVSRRRSSS